MTAPDSMPSDPMHGVTLAQILERLVDAYGWEGMADRVPVRCFELNPSMQSSLKFLRRTPWARAKVEALYLELVLGGAGFTGR
ncbi:MULTISPECIES: VF530 family protein [Deinococcus]|uniref:Transporter n=1 Tax=Deinococcus puniceus TaxID=1182568 RepID=A0A172T6N7_9DEIO|nr:MULTISPECIES: VF530 family protein [Deinococcus]ANE42705.1 transporter [Deinococcus puniceus]UQN07300.1 VF530 family protein [Deinococcus sp. QL22]